MQLCSISFVMIWYFTLWRSLTLACQARLGHSDAVEDSKPSMVRKKGWIFWCHSCPLSLYSWGMMEEGGEAGRREPPGWLSGLRVFIWVRSWSWGPGIEPHIRLSALHWGVCFSLWPSHPPSFLPPLPLPLPFLLDPCTSPSLAPLLLLSLSHLLSCLSQIRKKKN